jgi:hypothetical protein
MNSSDCLVPVDAEQTDSPWWAFSTGPGMFAYCSARRYGEKPITTQRVLLNFVHAFMIQTPHTALSNGTA